MAEGVPSRSRQRAPPSDPVLVETLAVLEMPRAGLVTWFEQGRSWCDRHGGRQYYPEVIDIYEECLALLAAEAAGDAP